MGDGGEGVRSSRKAGERCRTPILSRGRSSLWSRSGPGVVRIVDDDEYSRGVRHPTYRVALLVVGHEARVVDFDDGLAGAVDECEVGGGGLVDVGDVACPVEFPLPPVFNIQIRLFERGDAPLVRLS